LLINNELVTPPPSENILLGVTRETVMELARRELDRITRERVVDRTELYIADEIFLTGTGAQIAPVVEVDHRPIGAGAIGPLSEEIQRIYHEVVRGMRPEYLHWCTPVFSAQATRPRSVVRAREHAHTGANGNGNGNGYRAARGRSRVTSKAE